VPGQAVELGVLVAVVFEQGWRVVFRAVDHPGLQRTEDLAGVHGNAVAAHGVDGVDEHRVALHADLHAFEVGEAAYRFFGVDIARAAVHSD